MVGEDVFGMWSGWEMLEDKDVVRCSECGKWIPEDQAIHCRQCGVVLCSDCEVDGKCPDCAKLGKKK